ncbi:unnamed protein product [Arabidopsis arenosa]|uniref:TF-B3 domain-containing protein n=1 Tax=Arabidopsis arenosa TaxID=38785 RepID=A0A8S2ATW0_ARAAE|nr:unnamed protein product [Arabidopsis arenosa]
MMQPPQSADPMASSTGNWGLQMGNLPIEQSLKTELEAGPSLDDDNEDDNMGKLLRKKHVNKRIPETEAKSFSSDQSCFVAHVTDSNLRKDSLVNNIYSKGLETRNLSMKQSLKTELESSLDEDKDNMGMKKITLMDKHGVEWPVNLVMEKGNTKTRLGSGLKEFIKANGIKAYVSFVLELVWEDKTTLPMLKLCPNLHPTCSQV